MKKIWKTTYYKIEEKNRSGKPFRMVFLSDLHNNQYGKANEELLTEIDRLSPALILCAGDMVAARKEPQMDAALVFLQKLSQRYPVYCSNGNHEERMKLFPKTYQHKYEEYASGLRKAGVILLENNAGQIEIQGRKLTIWGFEISHDYFKRICRKKLSLKEMEQTIGTSGKEGYQILLAHHPAHFRTYAKWGADLTLSGHYHGGIIRLPFLGGVISPQMKLFPEFCRGMYEYHGKKMIVSAGLGTHTLNLRWNNPPELVCVEIE